MSDISVPLRTDKIIKNRLNILKGEKIIKIYIQTGKNPLGAWHFKS